MSGSWIDRLKRWFRTEPPLSDVIDPRSFEQLCRENPAQARAALLADQRSLADELERTYAAYEDRLASVSMRLRYMSDADVEREARTLRDAQDGLRRLIRRIDASAKTARDLERELREWERREDEEGPQHADHPIVRAELIRSELATRGDIRRIVAIAPERSPFRLAVPSEPEPEEALVAEGPRVIAFGRYEEVSDEPESIHHPDPTHLLTVIRMETREAERWHGHHRADPESIEQIRYLRELHAALKRIDREKGIRRHRMEYAVRMRGV
jgi:hypothetical protein